METTQRSPPARWPSMRAQGVFVTDSLSQAVRCATEIAAQQSEARRRHPPDRTTVDDQSVAS